MGIGDWGLGIGDWGLGQSPIPNPQSPIPNPQSPNPQSPITKKKKYKGCENNIKINSKYNLTTLNKNISQTKKTLKSWIKGWSVIIKFVLMHVTIIRGVKMWKELSFLKKYKEQKIK